MVRATMVQAREVRNRRAAAAAAAAAVHMLRRWCILRQARLRLVAAHMLRSSPRQRARARRREAVRASRVRTSTRTRQSGQYFDGGRGNVACACALSRALPADWASCLPSPGAEGREARQPTSALFAKLANRERCLRNQRRLARWTGGEAIFAVQTPLSGLRPSPGPPRGGLTCITWASSARRSALRRITRRRPCHRPRPPRPRRPRCSKSTRTIATPAHRRSRYAGAAVTRAQPLPRAPPLRPPPRAQPLLPQRDGVVLKRTRRAGARAADRRHPRGSPARRQAARSRATHRAAGALRWKKEKTKKEKVGSQSALEARAAVGQGVGRTQGSCRASRWPCTPRARSAWRRAPARCCPRRPWR